MRHYGALQDADLIRRLEDRLGEPLDGWDRQAVERLAEAGPEAMRNTGLPESRCQVLEHYADREVRSWRKHRASLIRETLKSMRGMLKVPPDQKDREAVEAVLLDGMRKAEARRKYGIQESRLNRMIASVTATEKRERSEAGGGKQESASGSVLQVLPTGSFVTRPGETQEPGVNLTAAQIRQIRKMSREGRPVRDIVRVTGVPAWKVRELAEAPEPRRRFSEGEKAKLRAQALELAGKGLSRKEIAEKLGISYGSTYQFVRSDELRKKPHLADVYRDKAAELREAGLTVSQIAEKLGISQSTVLKMDLPPPTRYAKKPKSGKVVA